MVENSKLLDEYDYVVYNDEDTHALDGAFLSFKTDFVIDEWKENNEETLIKSYFGVYPKAPEGIIFNQIKEQRKFIEKSYHNLKLNGIELNTIHQNYSNWNVPFFDPNDLKLKFVSYNKTNEDYDIKIIVNEKLCNVGIMKPTSWKIIDLLDNFYDVEQIIVLKNNEKILDLEYMSPKNISQSSITITGLECFLRNFLKSGLFIVFSTILFGIKITILSNLVVM